MQTQQVLIERVDDPHIQRVTWIDKPERLKPGFWVKLKEDDNWWKVKEIYLTKVKKQFINHSWKVGGL
jgi:hypothetical protein